MGQFLANVHDDSIEWSNEILRAISMEAASAASKDSRFKWINKMIGENANTRTKIETKQNKMIGEVWQKKEKNINLFWVGESKTEREREYPQWPKLC